MNSAIPPEPPALGSARHIQYWQRCLRTYLPTDYTGFDSTRMALGFFIVGSLDLLSAAEAEPLLSPADRDAIRAWTLSLRHPSGGFCGSVYHLMPAYTNPSATASTANIAATYFALLLLALAAVNGSEAQARAAFAGVDRISTLRWLRSLQRPDGSFGEVVVDGFISGGRDMRYCYLAAAIRWCIRGNVTVGDECWVEDINVPALVAHISRAQTYDGGMAESSLNESHAGYAYCAVSALTLLDRPLDGSPSSFDCPVLLEGVHDLDALRRFLAFRQDPLAEDQHLSHHPAVFPLGSESANESQDYKIAGFNGRWNKPADSCYFWWVSSALKLLGSLDLIDLPAARRFHLEKMQHDFGGFSKVVGDPPDIVHGFLGLSALGITGAPEVKNVDPALAVSTDAVRIIVSAREELITKSCWYAAWIAAAEDPMVTLEEDNPAPKKYPVLDEHSMPDEQHSVVDEQHPVPDKQHPVHDKLHPVPDEALKNGLTKLTLG